MWGCSSGWPAGRLEGRVAGKEPVVPGVKAALPGGRLLPEAEFLEDVPVSILGPVLGTHHTELDGDHFISAELAVLELPCKVH